MLKHIYDPSGRTRRNIFWPLFIVLTIVQRVFSEILDNAGEDETTILILLPLTLATIWPLLVLGIRRMHDIGKSGWYYFIPFAGFIGSFQESEYGANKWGENPKGEGNAQVAEFI